VPVHSLSHRVLTLAATKTPDYSFTLTPDPTLLFQFSALTYNAHAIHLDPEYARNQEGYPERLVHGPLTLILMLTALRRLLDSKGAKYVLRTVSYRNLAPLFVGQPLKVCVREMHSDDQFGIWVEGPGGSLCAKGTATAVTLSSLYQDAPRLQWLEERKKWGYQGYPCAP
jgi:hydroxyacyl-ACP dehydratase HTD2-like protein with hotdog domain